MSKLEVGGRSGIETVDFRLQPNFTLYVCEYRYATPKKKRKITQNSKQTMVLNLNKEYIASHCGS